MRKIKIILFIGIVIVTFIFIISINKISTYTTLSIDKCNSMNNDDCWHALAHQEINNNFCDKIINNETREHCLEHTPKR